MIKKWQKLAISIIICFIPAIIGSLFMIGGLGSWYDSLTKPWFTPPNWVFAPVWTALYLLMGLSLYYVWIKKTKDKEFAYVAFAFQLSLNAIWIPVFFTLHDISLALVVIIYLWIALAITIIWFYKISKRASYLLIPYQIWITIALLLNYYIMVYS